MVESDERKKESPQGGDAPGESRVADVCLHTSGGLKASCRPLCAASKVSLPQVARVLSEVYGDRMASRGSSADAESFPLQQKLLVCCLLLLVRSGRSREVVLGKVGVLLRRCRPPARPG